jgi:hypothetical protein
MNLVDNEDLDSKLFPMGIPTPADTDLVLELYKVMVASSEALVARRQGVNTFFLTVNGAILTALGLIVTAVHDARIEAFAVIALAATGVILALAWRSLLISFSQLNTGKFVVINRIEDLFPVAIYAAEWNALGEGKDPKKYRSSTSREVWITWTFFGAYSLAGLVEIGVVVKDLFFA